MKKQFVIIGCGRFGTSVAKRLFELGVEVMVVDKSEETIQNIADNVTYAVQADATDENSIKSLGIRNFDVAIVTIGSDIQSSILVTLMVKELGVKYVVAKAQNDMHAKVLYRIGADRVVFPEREMGTRIANNLVSDNILEHIQLAPDYSILEIVALKDWIGKTLLEVDVRAKYGINVMAIKHEDKLNIAVRADNMIKDGDVLVVIGHNDDLKKIEKS
ncbi:potassium channel family protein [Helicovermis profundi]|uniref:TrkA family potassium uptake protein n=1 Tax=Helicovermis profundi TaxID=3065157 RepID=A0AAU9EMV3_9FIRM|nr:TrkA family potassium uptake protein [Clostridia bacterium S502]